MGHVLFGLCICGVGDYMHMHEFVKGVKAKPPIFINLKILRKTSFFEVKVSFFEIRAGGSGGPFFPLHPLQISEKIRGSSN